MWFQRDMDQTAGQTGVKPLGLGGLVLSGIKYGGEIHG